MSPTRRIGTFVGGRRTKFLIVAFWVIVMAVAGPLSGKLTGAQHNDAVNWLPGSAESTKELKAAQAFQSGDTVPTVIVYTRSNGVTQADKEKVAADVNRFGNVDMVVGKPQGPVESHDGQALQAVVTVDTSNNGWEDLSDVVKSLRTIADDHASGLHVYIAGPGGVAADSANAFSGIDSTLLFAAAGVVVLILLLTYRSPILWLLPMASAFVALTTSQAVVYLLAKHAGLTVNAQSQGILTVLVFGAGTDYALLLVARYREELRRHQDRHQAMTIALHRASTAIIASASTVAVGMLCLLAAAMNSTRDLGPVLAIGIMVALVVMLTLLPALLVVVGRWVFWPVTPHFGTPDPARTGFWAKTGRLIDRRPRAVWAVTVLALGVGSLGLLNLHAGVLSNQDSFIGKPSSVVGAEVLSRHFPAGSGQPVDVVASASQAAAVRQAFESTPGIDAVTKPRINGGLAFMEGTLQSAPDSPAARAAVDRVRDAVHAVPDADALVGGDTAVALDVSRAAAHDNRLIMPIILAVVFLILALLLRALVAPIILVATVVLSFAAALGISSLVFDHLFHFAGVDTAFPLFVFVFLVALGIDYNIFLMTRVHEEASKHGTRRGALVGLAATGGVITSAGLVLAGTFSALATLPMVAFAEIGFAVALGVLLDTMIVRSILVTALNLDIGPRMWWPSILAKGPDLTPDAIAAEPNHPSPVSDEKETVRS
jgi:putative drug exporter of the RND superfamily